MGFSDAPDDSSSLDSMDKDVKEAQTRWKITASWESDTRKLFLDDYKFAEADSDNGYQWPNDIRRNRDLDERPCLTINKTRQHNLQIINDAKQNKPGIAVRPTGGSSTSKSAEILESVVRHIEYRSMASTAYDTATAFQVKAGIGYWRISTDYESSDTFDQEILIHRVDDPLCIYTDPDAKEADKSDMRFAFVFEQVPRDEFDKKYPQYKEYVNKSPLGADAGWCNETHVRICEYWRKVVEEDELILYTPEDGGVAITVKASELGKELTKQAKASETTKTRKIFDTKVERLMIVGNTKVESETKEWPGIYIPIVPLIGEETVIDGKLDRKGHTRALKDPQRIYNYWNSSAVEHVALQGKTPYIAASEAIEGYEDYWNSANTVNYAVLPYNGMDDAGNAIMAPARAQPPVYAPAYMQGMKVALDDMMYVSGQYQSMMGAEGNERTGKAIEERQRQGENSTYHFIDNLGISIRCTGKIILDLIPKIYDTKRIINIIAEDGTDMPLTLDPTQEQALVVKQGQTEKEVQYTFNPTVGKYDVEADIGPAYSTMRQEAFHAFSAILTQSPGLTGIIGDLVLRAADFPMAQEAAERLERMVPSQAMGTGPSQAEQQLTAQNQQLQGLQSELMDEVVKLKQQLRGKDMTKEVDAYKAESERIKILGGDMHPVELRALIHQLVIETLGSGLQNVTSDTAPRLDKTNALGNAAQGLEEPPHPDAMQAPNGDWYLSDPTRRGRLLHVGPLATQHPPRTGVR